MKSSHNALFQARSISVAVRFQNLQGWLDWQAQLHPSSIELGLDRVAAVWQQLYPHPFPATVVTVAGTNGKGSCVAMLDAILRAAGHRVGSYTSPHLLHYSERIHINGETVSDDAICQAFERIDQARGDTSLTYFEFGTLAALDIFTRSKLDIVILEVGLGGRLDAVNIIDPDVALITSIALDHTDWLGDDLEQIALEKAGILRANKPAVFAETNPQHSLLQRAAALNVPLAVAGRDFGFNAVVGKTGEWSWHSAAQSIEGLPPPALAGSCQLQNAAAVLQVIMLLPDIIDVAPEAIPQGLQHIELAGRFQVIPGPVELILDVAHNPAAAQVLADSLQKSPCQGRTLALFAMLSDKDVAAVVQVLAPYIDIWFLAALTSERGLPVRELQRQVDLSDLPAQTHTAPSVERAYEMVLDYATEGDRVLVFGSFFTVADVLQRLSAK
ncbi:MAG: bifunctional tetrahydrofolate synthase/dihydrofolate synthase [Candidatus Polarisedimenticolaceae bacterium]|nr:bifunctional tetrahydrofolate synthase/dihydrofolate synthase [Candidatus Polarisedimenticolaceae bacterium]